MTAPHSDRDRSSDPLERPFWPPAHRHAIETQRTEASCGARVCSVDYTHGPHQHTEHGIMLTRQGAETQQPVNAESVARGQQQVIEAQRATLNAVRALCDAEDARAAKVADRLEREGRIDGKTGRPYQIVGSLPTRRIRAILDAGPTETGDEPA